MVYEQRTIRTFTIGIPVYQEQDASDFIKDIDFIVRYTREHPATLLEVILTRNIMLRGPRLTQYLNYDFSTGYQLGYYYIHKFLDLFEAVLIPTIKIVLPKTFKTSKSHMEIKYTVTELHRSNRILKHHRVDVEYRDILDLIRLLAHHVRYYYDYETKMFYLFLSDQKEDPKDIKSNKICYITTIPIKEQEVWLPKNRPQRLVNMVNTILSLNKVLTNQYPLQSAHMLLCPDSVSKQSYYKIVVDRIIQLGITEYLGDIKLHLPFILKDLIAELKLTYKECSNILSKNYEITTEDLIDTYKFLYKHRDKNYDLYVDFVNVVMDKIMNYEVTVKYSNRKVIVRVFDKTKSVLITSIELEVEE
jgi:hypothetical protein